MPELLLLHCGIDPYELAIDLALGRPPAWAEGRPAQPCAALLVRSPATGILSAFGVPEVVAGDPDLVAVRWDKAPGAPVRAFLNGQDRIGEIFVYGDTWQDAETRALAMAGRLVVEAG